MSMKKIKMLCIKKGKYSGKSYSIKETESEFDNFEHFCGNMLRAVKETAQHSYTGGLRSFSPRNDEEWRMALDIYGKVATWSEEKYTIYNEFELLNLEKTGKWIELNYGLLVYKYLELK